MNRALARLSVLGGGLGLAAASALTVEKIAKLRDPAYVPTCSINPVIACGSVMDSPQAAAFGFPNPLIGIAAFAVVVTVGATVLAGFRPPRWFRVAFSAGTALGAVFVHWLIAASLYDIRALCPYCVVVWAVTIPLAWYSALDTWSWLAPLKRVHSAVLALWCAVLAALVLGAFWDHWTSLL